MNKAIRYLMVLSLTIPSLSIEVIKDKKIKKQFIGKAEKDTIDFDLRKAFPNDNEIAGLLKKQKDEVVKIDGDFRFTINEITRFIAGRIKPGTFRQDLRRRSHSFRRRIPQQAQ